MKTIDKVIHEEEIACDALMKARHMRYAGRLHDFVYRRIHNAYLYVNVGGPQFLQIHHVDSDWWAHTEGNGGFGCSWACCADTPVYEQVPARSMKFKTSASGCGMLMPQHPDAKVGMHGGAITYEVTDVPDDASVASVMVAANLTVWFTGCFVTQFSQLGAGRVVGGPVKEYA